MSPGYVLAAMRANPGAGLYRALVAAGVDEGAAERAAKAYDLVEPAGDRHSVGEGFVYDSELEAIAKAAQAYCLDCGAIDPGHHACPPREG